VELTLTAKPTTSSSMGAVGSILEAGPENQTFRKPVEVVVPFDPSLLAAGLDPSATLGVRIAPNGSNQFVALDSQVDLVAHTIRAKTIHFSQFLPAQDPSPTLSIVTSAELPLAGAALGYAKQFDVKSGTAPFTWSLEPGTQLPAGLALSSSGQLAGTPSSASGLSSFFVKVTDANAHAVQKAFSLTVVPSVANETPTVTEMTPTFALAGGGPIDVRMTGTHFGFGTKVITLEGFPLATTVASGTELVATVPASVLVASAAWTYLIVQNGPGRESGLNKLTIVSPTADSPVPTIDAVFPAWLPTSNATAAIVVRGRDFTPKTTATINGQVVPTAPQTPNTLNVTLPASFLSAAGILSINVSTGAPGGGVGASAVPLLVTGTTNPSPTISNITPSTVTAGSGNIGLAITGSSFMPNGQVLLGSSVAGSLDIITSTRSQVAIPSTLLTTPGTLTISFVNPAPGGGTAQATLTINAPTPPPTHVYCSTLKQTPPSRTAACQHSVESSCTFPDPAGCQSGVLRTYYCFCSVGATTWDCGFPAHGPC
jgi:hypothetical protein